MRHGGLRNKARFLSRDTLRISFQFLVLLPCCFPLQPDLISLPLISLLVAVSAAAEVVVQVQNCDLISRTQS